MSITATNNPYPEDPDAAPTKLDRGGYLGDAQTLDEKITANLTEVKALIETYKGSKDLGSIKPTSVPSTAPGDLGPAFWRATQNGIYTYFGGFEIPANYFAIFSRDANGEFSVSMTALDITGKVNVSDVINNLFSTDVNKPLSANQGKILNEKKQENDKTYTDLSGWLFANIDANNNIGFGIDDKGVFQIFTKLKVGGYEIVTDGSQFVIDYKKNNPNDYTEQSGYLQANIDKNGNIKDAVGLDGVWDIFMQIRKLTLLGNYEIKTDTTSDLSGYLNIWTDSANKILMGLKDDLSFEAGGVNLSDRVIKSRLIDSLNAWVFQKHVDGKTIIQSQSKLDGSFKTLSKTNCQNYNPSVTIDGLKTAWTTDDVEMFRAPLNLVYKNTDGTGNIEQVLPSFYFGGFGDSLLAGTGDSGAGGFFNRAMTTLGIPSINTAVGGHNSTMRGAAVGFLPMTVSVTGNSIPASGSVAITSYNISPFNVNGPLKIYGTLAGVYGWITHASNGTVLTFNIYNAQSSVTSCPAGSLFIPSQTELNIGGVDRQIPIRSENMMWVWEMHNDATAQITIDNFNIFRKWIKPIAKRIVVIGRTNDTNSVAMQADTNTLKAYYLSQKDVIFVDAMALALANAGTTQPELDAIANNWMPPSLVTDTVHYNPTFHALLANEIVTKITNANWNTKY